MIKLEIENKSWIVLIQAYATCIQSASGDLGAASRNLEMFKYIRNQLSQKDMIALHSMVERVQKENKIQLTMTMEGMGLKSEIEPLIKVVQH